jgi:hypothetical protein
MTRAVSAGAAGGSVLEMRVEAPAPEHRGFVDQAGAQFAAQMLPAIERFRDTLSARQAVADVPSERALATRQARFLSDPQR